MIELEQTWSWYPPALDNMRRPSQTRVDGNCANCGTWVIAHCWSLAGSGKRCPTCRSLLTYSTCFVDEVSATHKSRAIPLTPSFLDWRKANVSTKDD